MLDWFTWDWWQNLQQYSLWIMFFSAFTSATILPGNSEVIFVGLATPLVWAKGYFSAEVLNLLTSAVVGNTLGSLTTYWIGRLLPQANLRAQDHPRYHWARQKMAQHGSWLLLLSWLPVVGDLFCAVAGWMRLNWATSLISIAIGKLVRYVLLLFFGAIFLL